jgi:hypothetical protein
MHARKFALFVHVDGTDPVVLGKTCKYCSKCELIVAHQDELEELLARQFSVTNPGVIGNDYMVVGTVERSFWKAGMRTPPTMAETFEHMADIKAHLNVEYRPAGWYPADS